MLDSRVFCIYLENWNSCVLNAFKTRKCKSKKNKQTSIRSSPSEVLCKKVFLKIYQNSQEKTSTSVSFLIKLQALVCNFIKKETLAQVFSCKFCEMVKNTFFTEHLWMAAPVKNQMLFENKTFTDVYFLRHFVWK